MTHIAAAIRISRPKSIDEGSTLTSIGGTRIDKVEKGQKRIETNRKGNSGERERTDKYL
jgi:hypothetical protein